MNTGDFKILQSQFKRDGLLDPINLYGVLMVTFELTLSVLLVYGLTLVNRWSASFWLLELASGVVIFRWFAILHECGHKTLFTSQTWNALTGHLASIFCLVPYYPWRNIHLTHHRWVGVVDKDPTQSHLLSLYHAPAAKLGLIRATWKLWIPLTISKFFYGIFWAYPVERYRARDFHNARIGLFSDLFCVFTHLAIIMWLGFSVYASYFLPMLLIFLFVTENVTLPQHLELFSHLSDTNSEPIPVSAQDNIARSANMPEWLSTILAMNFNRHSEHHLFPAAPWYRLNRIRRYMLARGYVHPHEEPFPFYMANLRKRDAISVYRDALPWSGKSAIKDVSPSFLHASGGERDHEEIQVAESTCPR
ncbi:fatty acid desaturase [Dyella jejuensis]|uniref:Fatty acid desaturase n=1 Tax=Dyella jejuensis TaxID=1432009 RepID=A0ABW8JHF6_9GAMM